MEKSTQFLNNVSNDLCLHCQISAHKMAKAIEAASTEVEVEEAVENTGPSGPKFVDMPEEVNRLLGNGGGACARERTPTDAHIGYAHSNKCARYGRRLLHAQVQTS